VINLIDVSSGASQSIEISSEKDKERITISNVALQNINIQAKDDTQNIELANIEPQRVTIGKGGGGEDFDKSDLVPRDLTVLPQVQGLHLRDSKFLNNSRIYVDIDGTSSYATLNQIKSLNTKTILIDSLSDSKIALLSEGDFALVKER
jgi:hypothetical protein